MEVLGRQPCKREQELGWEGFHPSSVHQLFDGMPSQPEMTKEDQRISKHVPINSIMNKEEKWLDEALDRILEKVEQIETKRRCEEKIDLILEKLNEVEANRSKFFKEMSTSIKATVAVLEAASYPPLQDPPSSTPTTCSTACPNSGITWVMRGSSRSDEDTTPMVAMELGDNKDKEQAPYIVTKDLLKVTPTKCSTKCSSFNAKPDPIVAAVVTCATSIESSMELVATDSTTGGTHIDTPHSTKATLAKCSTVGLDVNGGTRKDVVAFPAIIGVSKTVPASLASLDVVQVVQGVDLAMDTKAKATVISEMHANCLELSHGVHTRNPDVLSIPISEMASVKAANNITIEPVVQYVNKELDKASNRDKGAKGNRVGTRR
uniref:Uncharacterized protein n=1 Tax=Oryza rufipogon TaxID=4529 RepID=A0A0E0QUE1_ORYRU